MIYGSNICHLHSNFLSPDKISFLSQMVTKSTHHHMSRLPQYQANIFHPHQTYYNLDFHLAQTEKDKLLKNINFWFTDKNKLKFNYSY